MKSAVVKSVFFLAIVFSYCAKAQMFSALAPPSKQKSVFSYTGFFYPETSIKDETENASMNRGLVVATVPVYKTDQESWGVSTLGQWLELYPDQNNIMPDLYQVDVGLTYSRMINEKKYWAANVNFGSASDKPFKDPSVNTLGANFFYMNPVDETATWVYLVNYSNNRPILNNIPIPGFAYIYTPSKSFRGTFGAPFVQLYWEFVDQWSLNFFTLIPWVIKSSVDYSIKGPMKLSVGWDFSQSTYYIYERQNRKDRLFYDEKRLYLGFKTPLSRQLMLETELGYAFDRRYFSAENYEPSPKNAVALGTSPYVKLQLTAFDF